MSKRTAGDADESLARGIGMIVVVGALLGIGFNALSLSSRPSRGLAWVGEGRVEAMPTLSELSPGDPGPAPSGGYSQPSDPMAVGAGSVATGLPEIPSLDRPIQIELAAVKALHDAGAVVVIDAREPDEYAEGHIPGAINLPFDLATAEPERLERLDAAGRPIVTYCGGGSCELSLSLAWELLHAGQTKVTVFMGGLPEWVGAGYPVERAAGRGV